jgi:hypothetical protein
MKVILTALALAALMLTTFMVADTIEEVRQYQGKGA